jgi:hypothetical protein
MGRVMKIDENHAGEKGKNTWGRLFGVTTKTEKNVM